MKYIYESEDINAGDFHMLFNAGDKSTTLIMIGYDLNCDGEQYNLICLSDGDLFFTQSSKESIANHLTASGYTPINRLDAARIIKDDFVKRFC